MKLLSDDIFSIRLANEASETQPPTSQVIHRGKATGTYLDGAVLEACIQVNDLLLAFMTDDCPFEECLRLYLLDDQLKILDRVTLGRIYTTGIFELLELLEPRTVAFQFFTDRPMSASVLPRKQFRLPFLSEPKGVFRAPGFSRRLTVSDNLSSRCQG